MENDNKELRDKGSRSLQQEMRRVFFEWTSRLPHLKNEPLPGAGTHCPEEEHPEQTSICLPAGNILPGDSTENKGNLP